MTKKTSLWHKMALLAACISASAVPAAFAAAPGLYELHTTGSVWGYLGTPCNGQVCSSWEMLNNDPLAIQIAAGAGTLYQLDSDGSVWQWNGTVCKGNTCSPWTQIGGAGTATQILAAGGNVYAAWNDTEGFGVFFQFTGQSCYNPGNCPGWTLIDFDGFATYYVEDYYVVKLTTPDGVSYVVNQYTGQPCVDNRCFGWVELESLAVPATLATGIHGLYELYPNGSISVLDACFSGPCPWSPIGDNTNSTQITAGNMLYQLQNNGTLLQYTGQGCNGASCDGWVKLDQNPAISYIIAGQNTVYEQHTNGSIWQYTGPCTYTLCSNWAQLDDNPLTKMVVPGY
jgi:hypothetical protein